MMPIKHYIDIHWPVSLRQRGWHMKQCASRCLKRSSTPKACHSFFRGVKVELRSAMTRSWWWNLRENLDQTGGSWSTFGSSERLKILTWVLVVSARFFDGSSTSIYRDDSWSWHEWLVNSWLAYGFLSTSLICSHFSEVEWFVYCN